MGRVAYGVRGIKLKKGDEVVAVETVEQGSNVFTVTEKGYGKRALCTGYRTQARGGSGVINVRCGTKNGQVVCLKKVTEKDEVILITDTGRTIRFAVRDIPLQNRGGLGVKLMDLQNEKTISGVAIIEEDEPQETDNTEK